MHELKRDYTLVIVTHNMQQAARVADMTAFFSLEVDRRRPARGPRRVRRDGEDLHPPVRQANRGLRHRALRMSDELPRGARTSWRRGSSPRATSSCARCAPRSTALERQDAELADEVIRFDDDVDACYLAIEQGIQNLLARQTPVAVDLRLVLAILHVNLHLERMARLLRDDREAGQADRRSARPSRRLIDAFVEMGSRAEEMIRVAVDSFAARDVARAEIARRARRADRPLEPARGRAGLRHRRTTTTRASGDCAC